MKKIIMVALLVAGMVITGQMAVSGEEIEAVSANSIYISEEDIISETSAEENSMPASYDARKLGYVTSLKRQEGGKCVTYATIAAMESNLLKQGVKDVDLSEKHLFHFMMGKVYDPLGYASWDCSEYIGEGTGYQNIMKALANGIGPVNESRTNAYTFNDIPEEMAYIQDYAVKNIFTVPITDRNKVKRMIMEYGGGIFSFFAGDDYRPDRIKDYAYYTDAENQENHCVELIGWDDGYSRNNFDKKPASDGAWLVKCSHGTYTWISYDNKCLYKKDNMASFIELEVATQKNNYHYDNTTYNVYFKPSGICMVAFESRALDIEQITSVGFANVNDVSECIVSIYKNPVFDSGEIVSYEDFIEERHSDIPAGYHVFNLSKAITVKNGDKFYGSFEFPKDTQIWATKRIKNKYYTSYNETAPGRYFTGFRKSDGTVTYTDLYNSFNYLELCLKIMTTGEINPVETPAPYIPPVKEEKTEPVKNIETPGQVQISQVQAPQVQMPAAETNTGWQGSPVKNENKRCEEGTLVLYKKYIYKVKKDGSVEFCGTKFEKNIRRKIVVPDAIKLDGYEYTVTSISKDAITNSTKVQSIEIGSNVKSIGKKAFYGCSRLKSVKFKTVVLEKVGKDAFAGSTKKIKTSVPKTCRKAYKRLGIKKNKITA